MSDLRNVGTFSKAKIYGETHTCFFAPVQGLLEYETTLGFGHILVQRLSNQWGFSANLCFVASGTDLLVVVLYLTTAFLRRIF